MNGAQAHLVLNHLPVLMPVVAAMMMTSGTIAQAKQVQEASLWLLIFSALCAIPTYLSGSSAEDVVKNYPDVSRLLIRDHEHFAQIAFYSLEALGTATAGFLYGFRTGGSFFQRRASWNAFCLLILISCGLMAWTAHLGGLIRHEEIRASDRF